MNVKLFELEPQRRDALLNAALKEFVLRGFDLASTNTIAKETDISKSLMFHYVKNKQELFLAVYTFFTELLEREYIGRLDFEEKDIFSRLRQSYLLQIKLIKQYPWILEFNKLSVPTKSAEINDQIEKIGKSSTCGPALFEGIDPSKFREELDFEKSKQFILWANIGSTNQIVEEIKKSEELDEAAIIETLDSYLNELKKIFYVPNNQRKGKSLFKSLF